MRNRLFLILAAHQKTLAAKLGNIEQKCSLSEEVYFIVKPPTVYSQAFMLANGVYEACDVHFTIFEFQRRDETNGRSCFHVTIDIASENSDKLKIHVYFDKFGNYCYQNAKSPQGENVSLSKAHTQELRFYAIQYAAQFYSPLETLYQEILANFNDSYSKTLCELGHLSMQVFGKRKDLSKIKEYCNKLEKLIELLRRHEEEHAIVPDKTLLPLLENLHGKAQEVLSETETKQMEAVQVELIRISEAIGLLKGATEEAAQVASLLQALEKLRPKVESLEDACVLTSLCSQFETLKKIAFRIIVICEISSTEPAIDKAPLQALVKIAPLTFKNVYRVVQNNKLSLLALMLAEKKEDINLDLCHPSTGYGLLEEAYEKKHTQALALLLNAGLNPNIRNLRGSSLLHRSCVDERAEEVTLFLKHGASILTRDFQGFTPLGVLICEENKPFNPTIFSILMNNSLCRSAIDFMQGQNSRRSTCLSFACQFNNEAAVAALLANGANPAACRETDYLNCLQICAWKGFASICRLILNNTPKDRLDSCVPAAANALKQAMMTNDITGAHAAHARFHQSDKTLHLQRKIIAKLLADYMENQKLALDSDDKSILLPQGTDFSSLMKVLGVQYYNQ